ncbi:MFS transporter [Tropicimonas sp. TH_r6]|uniref:MFS transporter n=1 Tax=Tropicimonas sp. TH_r6 TaxID=3082085 RepID=UPI002952A7F9|nr:MFS transporter [Tropicimonas sp. TH_r6]MDV7142700.1 MFS transporter [Tropicimonas sp. TH_r6]
MNDKLLSLRALFLSLGAIHIATAALGTLVALDIAATGGSQELASLVASAYSLGFLLGCFRIAGPLGAIGHIRAFTAAAALCALATLILSETANPAMTLATRFVTGLATAGLYAIGDAWINDTAEASSRGRILSIYSIVLGVCSVVSQVFVILYSDDVAGSFIPVSALFCIAIIVLASTRNDPKPLKQKANVRLVATYRLSPTAFVGAFLNGFIVTIMLNVLPFRAASLGVSSTVIAILIGAIYCGRILLQYPLGRASDRMDRRRVIALTSLALCAIFVLMAALTETEGSILLGQKGPVLQFFALVMGIFLGGTLLPLYSLLTAHAMDRTVPVYVGSTAVTLLFAFSVGGVAGPLATALLSATLGDDSLIWFVSLLMGGFAVFTLLRMKSRKAVPQAEHATHRPSTTTSVVMAPDSKRS